jgi:hypothetical protein
MVPAMTLAPFAARIPPVLVVTVDADDHVELRRRIPLAAPGRPDLLLLLHPTWPLHEQLPPVALGGLVVVAPYATDRRHQIAALCRLGDERRIPVVLVRFDAPVAARRPDEGDDDDDGGDDDGGDDDGGDDAADEGWPEHPVNAVVDVDDGRRHDVLDALARAFLEQAPVHLPLRHDGFAKVTLVHGDERRSAFVKALEHSCREHRVLGVVTADQHVQPGPALCFGACAHPPSSMSRYPLQDDPIAIDPRRYATHVDPPDDVGARAAAIAALHVAHGDWRATLATVQAFANGSVVDAADLLLHLGEALGESAVLHHDTLVARAAATGRPVEANPSSTVTTPTKPTTTARTNEARLQPAWVKRPPGFDADGSPWDDAGRQAFWAQVDDKMRQATARVITDDDGSTTVC